MGPERAVKIFKNRCIGATRNKVILYGSLASTGKGHLTDKALKGVFGNKLKIFWDYEKELLFHPNGMTFTALNEVDSVIAEATFYSTGGGAITEGGDKLLYSQKIYSLSCLEDIISYCKKSNKTLFEYVYHCEKKPLLHYLDTVWEIMNSSIENGLQQKGILPGRLKLKRKARHIFRNVNKTMSQFSSSELISA